MAQLSAHEITVMFLALGILLALARVLGEVAQRLGQPSVVGELLAGILLGPTVLGRLAPEIPAAVFPAEGNIAVVLNGMTTVAIALFLLVAGMEVELSSIWRQGRAAAGVAMAGFLIPFAVGLSAAAAAPYQLGCEPDADPRIFALFFATAISISALPVIAKTLMDLNLYRTDFGMIVIAAAVFNDVTGWIVFAITLGMLGAPGSHDVDAGRTILLTLGFTAFMLTLGRWLLDRLLPWVQAHATWPGGVLGFALALALLSAALTEWIGIHAIFGSFLAGVALGDSRHLRQQTRETILDFISFIFAPLFFAHVGLRIDFVAKFDLFIVVSVLLIACAGKVLGCGLTARLAGMDWPTSWALGFALNARGAMEIILGLLALHNGLIRQRMFVALVIMAMVTSMISGPAIQRLLRRRRAPRFTDFLSPRAFRPRLLSRDRFTAIAELVSLLGDSARIHPDEALRAVLAREERGPTGIGDQLAIPHARLPGLEEPLVAVGISQQGIDFDAPDGKPARLVFLLLLPEGRASEQLNLMADIAATLQDAHARESAASAENYTQFLAALKAWTRRSGRAAP